MIQRIQSVYLFLAALFLMLFYFFPIASFTTNTFSFEFFNCHITHPENLKPPIALLPLAIFPFLSVILSFVSIFLFKKRKLQLRIGKLNLLTVFITIGISIIYFLKLKSLLEGTIQFGFSGLFPIITFVMLILANRAIQHDENLIRAADRIR